MRRVLHGHALSGNTHKVRLLLGYLDLAYEERAVDIPAGAQRRPEYLALNPLGLVPVLEDGDGACLRDSQAILIYLVGRYGAGDWWPAEPEGQGRVAQWLSFAANEVQNGLNLARLHALLGAPVDVEAAQALGRRTLDILEARLSERDWLELDRPTIAECAVLPYVALAPEGGVPLEDRPAVRAWIDRCRALPGFTPMPGLNHARADRL